MDDKFLIDKSIMQLCATFYECSIDHFIDFYAYGKASIDGRYGWFSLRGLKSERDLIKKVLRRLSRATFDVKFCRNKEENEEILDYILRSINHFLNTDFTVEDMKIINHLLWNEFKDKLPESLMDKFIDSNYDMNLLKKEMEK